MPDKPKMIVPAPFGTVPISPEEETKMPCPTCAVGMVSVQLHQKVARFLAETPKEPSSKEPPIPREE